MCQMIFQHNSKALLSHKKYRMASKIQFCFNSDTIMLQ
jgi:hypothetical protein